MTAGGRRAELRRLLTAHSASDGREEGYRKAMLALLETPGDPFSRDHFTPGHFTASAFILSPDDKELLLILHSKLGLWLQPGGHVDPNDPTLLAAALREAQEETGLTDLTPCDRSGPLLDLDVHPIPENTRKAEPAHRHFDVRFLLRSQGAAATAGSDAEALRWVRLEQAEDAGTDDSVRRAVRKIQHRS